MQSNRSEYSHRRQYSDRSSRQWDDYDHRWEERREPHRDIPPDAYQKYGGDRHGCTEGTSRSREYSCAPKMVHSKDSMNRDWSRKSSARRRMSSPDWSTSEKKRQRFTEDDKDDYRYRHEPEDKSNRLSPDSFSHAHLTKDFKHTLPQEEYFKYRKTPQDSRHRYQHEEATYRQHDDCRQLSGYYKDRDGCERSRDCSQERTQSREPSTKSYAKTRERNESPSTDHDDYRQNRSRIPLNGSNGQSLESDATDQSAAVPEPMNSTRGFQRFLDVLNKGVNVATLTKIVTQTPLEVDDQSRRPTNFMDTNRPWSPSFAGRQQGSHQNSSQWPDSEGSQRLASPQPLHRSFSPTGRSLSDEKSLQRGNGERSNLSSNSRSRSPSAVEKITLTPEDEHKHRQMLDVLQAIGMNLGTEELGQMSHRIQERLYGKKDGDRHRTGSREVDARRAISPRLQSRSSSSSRSSFSPINQEYYKKKDSYSAQKDVTDVHQAQVLDAVEYGQNSGSSTLQKSEKFEAYSQESIAACQAFSQNSAYTLSNSSPTPAIPMYSPVTCSPLPYPALSPALSPVLSPALPPNLPRLGPRFYLPRLPPVFPYPRVPPVNLLPAVLTQTRHLLPQHVSNPPFFNLPGTSPIQALNTTQKPKPVSRPRCLQVIETKQPG